MLRNSDLVRKLISRARIDSVGETKDPYIFPPLPVCPYILFPPTITGSNRSLIYGTMNY